LRIGVIDIGTNSTRFLVTDTTGGFLRSIGSGLISSRLGEGLASGALADRAVDRTISALRQFMVRMGRLQPDRVAAVATSAVRDAVNKDDFLRRVKDETGLAVQVLSGPEEARMSYLGVVKGLNAPMEHTLVIDIGGGSTEFIWRDDTGDISYRSTQAGAVRMTEGGHGMQKIRDVLRTVVVEISTARPRSLVGVGGTVTTLAAIDQALEPYNPEKVHGYYLSKERIVTLLRELAAKNSEERTRIPGLQPERADIIVAGVQIAVVILEELNLPGITVSETDIMYGVAYNLLEKIYG
jgi:exopolyphosphatase/guanosine-5'-triphosphate,3'-diphosphate pyrophosphatase